MAQTRPDEIANLFILRVKTSEKSFSSVFICVHLCLSVVKNSFSDSA